MRLLSLVLAGIFLVASSSLFAELAITPDETKAQAEFNKAYRVPDKDARKTALGVLSNAKHSSSFKLLYGVATSDPEAEVRQAAFEQLAKAPAHDPSNAALLAQIFSSLKTTSNEKDQEAVVAYGKALAPVEFKTQLTAAFIQRLTSLRYQKIPALMQQSNGQTNAQQIANVKKQRKHYEDLLEAFNGFVHSEVSSATEDSPNLLKKWWEANQAVLAKADRDLLDKYKKEDADAAKAAAEAAKAAK